MGKLEKDMGQREQSVETDPNKIKEREYDSNVQFLDLYRSISNDSSYSTLLESVVSECVKNEIIPVQVRFGIMENSIMKVARGVIKSLDDNLYYFNYGNEKFRLVPVYNKDEDRKIEAEKLLNSCDLGCDLVDVEKIKKAPQSGTVPQDEEQFIEEQQKLLRDRHPGATGGDITPDREDVGRNWHEDIKRSSNIINAVGDGISYEGIQQNQWSKYSLIKAYGESLRRNAPNVRANLTDLEIKFAVEELGKSVSDINSGIVTFSPWDRKRFLDWKSKRLRKTLNYPLQKWLNK